MRIVVCVKQAANGDLNPFDACAYEAALRIPDAEVILLSMAPMKSQELLLSLTRLGAKKAILLSDRAFVGADTLATAYALSKAVEKLAPDLVICGRQTVDGDTGQTGPGLAEALSYNIIPNVMEIIETSEKLTCRTRTMGEMTVSYPALITVERINNLRLPSIRSKVGEVEVWTAADVDADPDRIGLHGSPTKVLKSFENEDGKRHCTFITPDKLDEVIALGIERGKERLAPGDVSEILLKNVWIVGEKPRSMAETISDDITVIPLTNADEIAERARREKPSAILWASDAQSKMIAPQVAWKLQTGLCADCTYLETDGQTLMMYRPAFSGNIIAKIACVTEPAMATVRTPEDARAEVIFALGKGAREILPKIEEFAAKYNAEIAASRAAVDCEMFPYECQVGLTGKSVNPSVYVAMGISGAVHHVEGMKQSGTVIAINPDKSAPIFDYADYGIVADVADIVK